MKLPPLPTHGPDGIPLTGCDVNARSAADIEREMWRPRRPERQQVIVDDETGASCGIRELTRAEYAAELWAWRRESKEYRRVGPKPMLAGLAGYAPPTQDRIEITGRGEGGFYARGIWTGDEWHWTEWGWNSEAKKA